MCIDKVMRHNGKFLCRGFGCTNIHFPVDLAGISRDYLRMKFLRNPDGGLGFTDSRWAYQYNKILQWMWQDRYFTNCGKLQFRSKEAMKKQFFTGLFLSFGLFRHKNHSALSPI